MANSDVTAARLREVLNYDPETGIFTWRVRLKYSVPIGARAGSFPANGYCMIGIDGVHYRAHRLAWLYVYGEWPKNFIDHIDGNRLNNAIANLRDVSNKMNGHNTNVPRRGNKTGLLGVLPYKNGKFTAQIGVNGKSNHLGVFDTAEEAHATYMAAKRYVHEGFVRRHRQ
jgi:hypothetical protein